MKLKLIFAAAVFQILAVIAMLAYACTMQGFGAAAKFLFYPDFGKITVNSVLSALGLALFTLCVGVGCIAAYAASLSEGVRLVRSSVNIVFINIAIGLMMGLIVFTFISLFIGMTMGASVCMLPGKASSRRLSCASPPSWS